MKRYNLSQIMKSAHRTYKRYNGNKSFSDCLKFAWMMAKSELSFTREAVAKKDIEFAKAINAPYSKKVSSKRSPYDSMNIPASAYYNPYSKGPFGSQYVGD